MKNFATAVIDTPPSPNSSGTTLSVNQGQGTRLILGYATVHPENTLPTLDTAEVVEITNISGDNLTVVRAQKDTEAQQIGNGWRITNGIYAEDIVTPDDEQDLSNKTLLSPKINLGSDATNDIYYRNASGELTRLPAGSEGQVLKIDNGNLVWDYPRWTAEG